MAFISIFCGCESTPTYVRRKQKILQPSLKMRVADGGPLVFGQIAEADFIVINTANEPILVRSVQMVDQLPRFFQKSISLGGQLTHKKALKTYVYNPDSVGTTPQVFEDDWLLLPGESKTIPLRFRVRHFNQIVHLLYRRIPYTQFYTPRMREAGEKELATLDKDIYFPESNVHQKNTFTYKLRTRSRLQDFQKADAGTIGRLLIVPDEEVWELLYQEFAFPVPISDEGTQGSIIERSGASVFSTATAWLKKQMWVVDDPEAKETFGWTADEKKIPLPRCTLEVFDILDELPEGEPIAIFQGSETEQALIADPKEIETFIQGVLANKNEILHHIIEGPEGQFSFGLKIQPPGSIDRYLQELQASSE